MIVSRARAHVRVRQLTKTFALAEKGTGPVSLLKALRTGRPDTLERKVRALDDVSFDISEGERVGIIGRNGAGKTTLLSLLAGITDPTFGTIEIAGDVHAMLTIGSVLRDEATGRENIFLDGTVHGKSQHEIASHVETIIAFSELGEFIDRPVRTYSSGMKARLAFSMAAFIEPDILIIDETLSVGDAFFSAKASRRMREITAEGRIIIVVSHALATINDTCDRCLWLEEGRLVLDGSAKAVTEAYERAVEQADEVELVAKFGANDIRCRRPSVGQLDAVVVGQEGTQIVATARAFVPLSLMISGQIVDKADEVDLAFSILRVDGRRVASRRLSASGLSLPTHGAFTASVMLDPFILSAGLYRFEVVLLDSAGTIDVTHRVIEVVNEKRQSGGQPLLLCPPLITTRPIGESA